MTRRWMPRTEDAVNEIPGLVLLCFGPMNFGNTEVLDSAIYLVNVLVQTGLRGKRTVRRE